MGGRPGINYLVEVFEVGTGVDVGAAVVSLGAVLQGQLAVASVHHLVDHQGSPFRGAVEGDGASGLGDQDAEEDRGSKLLRLLTFFPKLLRRRLGLNSEKHSDATFEEEDEDEEEGSSNCSLCDFFVPNISQTYSSPWNLRFKVTSIFLGTSSS